MKQGFLLALMVSLIACNNDVTVIDQTLPDVWIDSFQQPHEMNGIDIVWVLDKSCSMQAHKESVIAGIEQMMDSLPPANWRLGITSASPYGSSIIDEFPLVPGDSSDLANDIYDNLTWSQEEGFSSLESYMYNEYNRTWFRPDAGLLTVFVSDEDDQSEVGFNTPSEFVNWYRTLRPNVFAASIINVDPADSVCSFEPPIEYIGKRYMEATNTLNGVVIDICETDWSPGMTAALIQIELNEEWELSQQPIESTIIVFVDNIEYHGWIYVLTENKVIFTTIPGNGTFVEIGYIIED